MMGFQVFPEPQRQRGGQPVQGAVVDAGLAFAQVVHEQVADGTTRQVVPVDQLLGAELAGEPGADHPDRGRRAVREDPGGVQELVEERAVLPGLLPASGEKAAAAVQQLQAVARGDVADQAALGRHDQRDPLDRGREGGVSDGARLAQRFEGGDPAGVTDPGHLPGDASRRASGQQPGQGRPQGIAADQLKQPQAKHAAVPFALGADGAGSPEIGKHPVPPVRPAVDSGAGGVPAFLPRRPRMQFQPVQRLQERQLPPLPGLRAIGQERGSEHPPHQREPVCGRRVPGGRDGAGREVLHHRQRLGAELPRPGCRPGGHRGGHQRPFPNSASRLSGR